MSQRIHPQEKFSYQDEDGCIWFFFTSTMCKWVEFGTETITRPVYEIVCE